MSQSSIEWTEETWNPVTGCTRVSKGCDNCYAASLTRRLAAMGHGKYQGLINHGKNHFNGVIKCHEETLEIPIRRRKPTMFFVNSMSDLFHPDVPTGFIWSVFEVMAETPQHTFQILTKRPARMSEVLSKMKLPSGRDLSADPLANVWLGTSIEDESVSTRIDELKKVPAAVRFLSCEPLLGPLDLQETLGDESISWVIVGGESGLISRPMEKSWVLSIKQACHRANVAFFFKQWGGRNKKKAGRDLDGVEYNDFPAVPNIINDSSSRVYVTA